MMSHQIRDILMYAVTEEEANFYGFPHFHQCGVHTCENQISRSVQDINDTYSPRHCRLKYNSNFFITYVDEVVAPVYLWLCCHRSRCLSSMQEFRNIGPCLQFNTQGLAPWYHIIFSKTVIRSVVILYVILTSKWKSTVRLTVITSCCPFCIVSIVTLTIPLATVRLFTWPGSNTTSIPDAGVLSGFRTSAWDMRHCIRKCYPIKYVGWGWAKHPGMFVAYKFQVPLKRFRFCLCWNKDPAMMPFLPSHQRRFLVWNIWAFS